MTRKVVYQTTQSGMTLIELMLALAIASILMLGASSLYVTSKRGYKIQDNLARQQENSRFSLELLLHDMRIAGYPKTFIVEPIVSATTTDGGGATNDSITVQYQSKTDCLGLPTPACIDNPGFNCAVNHYFIDTNNNLACHGNGGGIAGSTDVIAENITNMQILYGVDTDSDHVANKYVTWSNVAVNERSKIVSIRFALLTQTPNEVKNASTNNITYALLDQNITPNDKRIHRVYSSTVLIRNREQ